MSQTSLDNGNGQMENLDISSDEGEEEFITPNKVR